MDEDATVREWTDLLARIRFGTVRVSGKNITSSRIKAVAYRLANYADSDGSRVRPGLARLAVDLEISYDTAGRAVQHLASLGLLRLVRPGTRPGHADVYQLAIPADLLDRVDVLQPTQHQTEIDRTRAEARGRYRGKPAPDQTELLIPEGGADPVDNSGLHLPQGPADIASTDPPAPPPGSADSTPAPPPGSDLHLPAGGATYQGPRHNTDRPTNRDPRTDLTGPRANGAGEPDSDVEGGGDPSTPDRCDHGVPRRLRCPACTRGLAQPPAPSPPADDDQVWVATKRRGIEAHRPGDGFTACERSMRTGQVLLLAFLDQPRLCPRCWPVAA